MRTENNWTTEKISLPVMLRAAPAGYCHIIETRNFNERSWNNRTEYAEESFLCQYIWFLLWHFFNMWPAVFATNRIWVIKYLTLQVFFPLKKSFQEIAQPTTHLTESLPRYNAPPNNSLIIRGKLRRIIGVYICSLNWKYNFIGFTHY